jgi:hypothetical protein
MRTCRPDMASTMPALCATRRRNVDYIKTVSFAPCFCEDCLGSCMWLPAATFQTTNSQMAGPTLACSQDTRMFQNTSSLYRVAVVMVCPTCTLPTCNGAIKKPPKTSQYQLKFVNIKPTIFCHASIPSQRPAAPTPHEGFSRVYNLSQLSQR